MRSPCFVVVGRAIAARTGVFAGSIAALAAAAALGGFAPPAHAWLGSFEAADGYQPFLNMVQNYNAGQYGPSSGYLALSPAPITPNTGLWRANAGGFFSGPTVSYVTGHQNWDRQWMNSGVGLASNQGLVITTNHEGWGGPSLQYEYDVDAQDLGGVSPAATATGSVKTSFWVRGQLAGPEAGGLLADGFYGNEVAFMDSLGNVGAAFGLTQRASGDTVTYWDGAQMFESALVGNGGFYDRWDITIDLASDTFSASYFQFSTSTSINLVTGAPLMTALSDFSTLRFTSSPGVNNSKLWGVDDFSFETRIVPAPASLALLLGAAAAAGRRRR